MLMKKVYQMEINIQMLVKKNFLNENVIIVCADIEDQIMGLQEKDREDFMLRIWNKKYWIKQFN